ncbi:MAG: hypothetical protein LBN10_01620 [Propionibacteriaceae bacterium]|nr:hypothetical protein [Propionibacteriaceae bacterium]
MSKGSIRFRQGKRQLSPTLVIGWVYDEVLLPGIYQLEAMRRFGVPIINDALTLLSGQNKYINSAMLHKELVPHMDVFSGTSVEEALNFADRVGYPVVSKPIVGFGGNGLARYSNPGDLKQALLDLPRLTQVYLVPFIRNPGRDIRVTCVNFHPVFAFYRNAPDGSWITNMDSGGVAEPAPLDAELIRVASRAAQSANARFAGVDVVEDLDADGAYRVFEVNTCPSTIPPVLREFADFISCAASDFAAALRDWKPSHVFESPAMDSELFFKGWRVAESVQ